MSHANFLSSKSSGQQKIGFRATQSQDMLTWLRLTLHSETRCGSREAPDASLHSLRLEPHTALHDRLSHLCAICAIGAFNANGIACSPQSSLYSLYHHIMFQTCSIPSVLGCTFIHLDINIYQPIPSINRCDIWRPISVSSEASNESFGAGEDFAHALVAHRNGIRIRTALAVGMSEEQEQNGTNSNIQ